jgi:hypothetical protein
MRKMTASEFKRIFDETVAKSGAMLIGKATEYASDADRLHNFKQAAALQQITPIEALGGMMCKHTISVYDMINSVDDEHAQELWDEKIIDSINYLILLRALVIESKGEAAAGDSPAATVQRFNEVMRNVSDSPTAPRCGTSYVPPPGSSQPVYGQTYTLRR